jgi:hypothetical protein
MSSSAASPNPVRDSERWVISTIKGGRGTRSLPCGTAAEAVIV